MQVDTDLPLIPEARVELGEVQPGTQVVKVGFGCEDRANKEGGNNSDPRVVGVNSDYQFLSGSGISSTDWHTRTSLRSRYSVGRWLLELKQREGIEQTTDRVPRRLDSAWRLERLPDDPEVSPC